MRNAHASTVWNQKTRIERILEPFGARHAAGLNAFFDKIAKADFDFVIFMARKALCVYRTMELCGIAKIAATVVSDALLDGRAEMFRDRRVLVVDDTLFVGTTLSDAKKKLTSCAPAHLEFWVYCADTETWSPTTFRPDYIHEKLSDQETIEFCAAECRAMINAGMPYLSDFSASRRIRMKPVELDRAIKPVSWIFHDVSSQYHERCKVKYYSAFPDQYTKSLVRSVVGDAIFELIDLAKIRAFATWTGRVYEVTFVPVITFSPTDQRNLRKAVRALSEAFSIDQELTSKASVAEQMRFLQYLIGGIYLRTYWDSLDDTLIINPGQKFNHDWCATVFSGKQSEAISTAIGGLYDARSTMPTVMSDTPRLVRAEPKKIQKETKDDVSRFLDEYFSAGEDVDFGHTPLSDLTAIFLKFQSRFEDAAREEIKIGEPNPKYRDRLKRGMAWRSLCRHLLKGYKKEDSVYNRNILSLVLDRLIDFGIAVPIIAQSDGHVYRAYRHGEDVKFGAQEESLIYELFQGFQAGRNSTGIEATYVEKLIVILLRVGMSEEWLTLWYHQSDADTMVRVGYHLQGAVPMIVNKPSALVPESEADWLSRRLLKTGTLEVEPGPTGRGKIYRPGKRPQAAHLRTDARRTAKLLGLAIGQACIAESQARSPERPVGSEDLIILTSCANILDTTGAVAAEMRLFCDWFETDGLQVLRANFGKPSSVAFNVTVVGGRGAQAIHSAGWKLSKYRAGAVNDLRRNIEALSEGGSQGVLGEEFWPVILDEFTREPSESEAAKMHHLQNSAADILVAMEFLLKCVEYLRQLGKGTADDNMHAEFAEFLRGANVPIVVDLPDLVSLAVSAEGIQEAGKTRAAQLEKIAQTIRIYGRSLCDLAGAEAMKAERLVLKTSQKMSRTQYSFMIWYDILDVRVRKQSTPDGVDEYASAINAFRSDINSMLVDAQRRIREAGGEVFCDTGDIGSINDSKHIFINTPSGGIAEGARIVCDIVRLAESTGVKLRVLGLPTNLRGEFVYLNRGATSIDGDFKSHVHTIIQKIQHHESEDELGAGECIVWFVKEFVKSFRPYGSVRFHKHQKENAVDVAVTIRGVRIVTSVGYIRSQLS